MATKHEHGRDRIEKGGSPPQRGHSRRNSLRSNDGAHVGKVIGDKTHITGQEKIMGSSEPGRKKGMRGGGQTGRNTPATPEFQAPRFAGVGTRRNPPKGYRGSF